MKKILFFAVGAALLAVPAVAQQGGSKKQPVAARKESTEQCRARKRAEFHGGRPECRVSNNNVPGCGIPVQTSGSLFAECM